LNNLGGRGDILCLLYKSIVYHYLPLLSRRQQLKKALGLVLFILLAVGWAKAQSTDIFVMPGTDFSRPGLYTRANLNIGIGHVPDFLAHNDSFHPLLGTELTFAYTYENAGSYGWLHSNQGAHTEAIGEMRNFQWFTHSKAPLITEYTWVQLGLTSITGGNSRASVQNRFYNGDSFGLIFHLNPATKGKSYHSIWLQETYNKVVTIPWYTSTSIGYTYSF
jgi:hypothetical protein